MKFHEGIHELKRHYLDNIYAACYSDLYALNCLGYTGA